MGNGYRYSITGGEWSGLICDRCRRSVRSIYRAEQPKPSDGRYRWLCANCLETERQRREEGA